MLSGAALGSAALGGLAEFDSVPSGAMEAVASSSSSITSAIATASGAMVGAAQSSGSSNSTISFTSQYIINEGFEGTGTPSGWFNGSSDFDYTTGPIAGAQSLRIAPPVTGLNSYAVWSGDGTNRNEVWLKLNFKIIALPNASGVNFIAFDDLAFSGGGFGFVIFNDGSATTDFVNYIPVGTFAPGGTYTIWIHYRKSTSGSNGYHRVWYTSGISERRPLRPHWMIYHALNKQVGQLALGWGSVAQAGEVLIDNVQLSASDIFAGDRHIDDKCIAHWALDETSGNYRRDAVGSVDLLESYGAVASAAGKIGDSAAFTSGTFRPLTAADPVLLDFGVGVRKAFAGWVYLDSSNPWGVLFGKSDNGTNPGWYVQINGTTGTLDFVGYYNAGTPYRFSSTQTVPVGAWTFFAISYDGANVKVWINGNSASVTAYTDDFQATAHEFSIGVDPSSSTMVSAKLDSLSVFEEGLTDADVALLWNDGDGLDFPAFAEGVRPTDTDLVLWLKMDEASGTRFDAHASNDFSEVSSVPSVTGLLGNGADFGAGTLSRASNSDVEFGADTPFTLSFWMKPDVDPVFTGRGVLGKGVSGPGNSSAVYFWFANGGPDTGGGFYVGNGSSHQYVPNQYGTLFTNSIGKWVHVTLWHDPVLDLLCMQINGGLIQSRPWAGGTHASNTAALILGTAPSWGLNLDGKLDEFAMWKRVLTSDERVGLYNAGRGITYEDVVRSPETTDLVAYYEMEEASGTRNDSHGTNHLNAGSPGPNVVGKVGNAAAFDNFFGYNLKRADNAALSITGSKSFSFWYYDTNPGFHEGIIFKDTEFTVWKDNSDRIFFKVFDASGNEILALNPEVVAANTWYHVVATYDATEKVARLYLNAGAPTVSSVLAAGAKNGTSDFQVGHDLFVIDGYVDELSVWDRALSIGEITWLYNDGDARSYDDLGGGGADPGATEGEGSTTSQAIGTLTATAAASGVGSSASQARATAGASGSMTGRSESGSSAAGSLSGTAALVGASSSSTQSDSFIAGKGAMAGAATSASAATGIATGLAQGSLSGVSSTASQARGTLTATGAATGVASSASQSVASLRVTVPIAGATASASQARGSMTANVAAVGSTATASAARATATATAGAVGSPSSASQARATLTAQAAMSGAGMTSSSAQAQPSSSGTISGVAFTVSQARATWSAIASVTGIATSASQATLARDGTTNVFGVGASHTFAAAIASGAATISGRSSTASSGVGTLVGIGSITGRSASHSAGTATTDALAQISGRGASASAARGTITAIASMSGRGATASQARGNISATVNVTGRTATASAARATLVGSASIAGHTASTSSATIARDGLTNVFGYGFSTSSARGTMLGSAVMTGRGMSAGSGVSALRGSTSLSAQTSTASSARGTVRGNGTLEASGATNSSSGATLSGFGATSGRAMSASQARLINSVIIGPLFGSPFTIGSTAALMIARGALAGMAVSASSARLIAVVYPAGKFGRMRLKGQGSPGGAKSSRRVVS